MAQGSRRHPHTWPKHPGDGQRGTAPGRHLPHGQRSPSLSRGYRYCRVHDVDNVYVIDGSVHVTNGGFNPATHQY